MSRYTWNHVPAWEPTCWACGSTIKAHPEAMTINECKEIAARRIAHTAHLHTKNILACNCDACLVSRASEPG